MKERMLPVNTMNLYKTKKQAAPSLSTFLILYGKTGRWYHMCVSSLNLELTDFH